jgi:hypothetical protein
MQECLARQKVPAASRARLIELALGSPGRALRMSREERIQAIEEAERLWQALPAQNAAQILVRGDAPSRGARATRGEIEERLEFLLWPALRELRGGRAEARRPVRLLQEALTQLRQNVQPQLVYDNLLLQLAGRRKGPGPSTKGPAKGIPHAET